MDSTDRMPKITITLIFISVVMECRYDIDPIYSLGMAVDSIVLIYCFAEQHSVTIK